MLARFLLGPAGSGKTVRCLDAVRTALRDAPDGPPILFLAPKQATFQLERRLLEDPGIPGWSRLQVLSFERLARQLLETWRPVRILDEDARIMVLRALLRRHQGELRVFHAAARLTGFAQEVNATLRELQGQGVGPDQLLDLAQRLPDSPTLADKLRDLALLLRHYRAWLADHAVEDADTLPDLATALLRQPHLEVRLDGLWVDGFAEMTSQEIELLAALVARSREATLAFCLDPPTDADVPWRSTWTVVHQTVRRVHNRLLAEPGCIVQVETLPRSDHASRFTGQPTLAHLERSWDAATPATEPARGLHLVECRDPEREAEIAAREVWREVRAGARFRDLAVLVRSLEGCQDTLAQVFTRYEIPFFIDRRSPLAHHPLAELTRCALRLAAFDWPHEDWFGALKTGLTPLPAAAVDTLENEALAHGWEAATWRQAAERPPGPPALADTLARGVRPFLRFIHHLGSHPEGGHLASSLHTLWADLDVESTLLEWSDPGSAVSPAAAFLHRSALEQLRTWLKGIAVGFAGEHLPLAEWLPILDAGLASLTAGVIPPCLDQVLIGAIDRSRQPELEVALVLGLNEGHFPAPPAPSTLLTPRERESLLASGVSWITDLRRQIGHERYYGYIALTRARRRLVLTWSQRDDAGRPLNPSAFIRHLRRVFPDLPVAPDEDHAVPPSAPPDLLADRLLHRSELLPWLLRQSAATPLDALAGDPRIRTWLDRRRHPPPPGYLPAAAVRALWGRHPEVSVTALESLGACPFQFFVRHGLRGAERERRETDPRKTGSLAHALLARFHESVMADRLRWCDLTPAEAVARFDHLAPALVAEFAEGLFTRTPEARWQAAAVTDRIRSMLAVLVRWASTSDFHPTLAEVAFGGSAARPAWSVPVPPDASLRIRGTIDRVDLREAPGQPPQAVVIDYKLRPQRLDDTLLAAGIDLQLATYALALQDAAGWPDAPSTGFLPAGMFLVALRGRPDRSPRRSDLPDPELENAALHVHRGRCRASAVTHLDRGAPGQPSGQFALRINRDGSPRKGGDLLRDEEFDALLARAREALQRAGAGLIAGDVRVLPYRYRTRTACDQCDLQAICRVDPATQTYRTVPSRPDAEATQPTSIETLKS